MVLFWLALIASLMAVAGCAYLAGAVILVSRFARPPTGVPPAHLPTISVLKPLHGVEPALLENLASFCLQDYSGRVQYIFGLQSPQDEAIAVVKQLGRPVLRELEIIIDDTTHGTNGKISNLINMAPRIRGEVVVLADSDMRVEPSYLSRLVTELAAPEVDALTCLYHGVATTGCWAQLSALGINAHFLPSVIVSLKLGLAQPCFGSTIALRRETLALIGDFSAFADTLADDYAIGAALRVRGYRLCIPPFSTTHVCSERSVGELWRHELRWARTIKSIDPLGHLGAIITYPLPFALIAAAAGATSIMLGPAIVLVVVAVIGRLALLRAVARAFGLPPQAYWLVPVRDLMSFAIFVASFFGHGVSWRGKRFRLARDGTLSANRRAPTP